MSWKEIKANNVGTEKLRVPKEVDEPEDDFRDCENCVHYVPSGEGRACEKWVCEFEEVPESCDKCEHSIENVEEQYDRVGVWYECELCEGGCNKGEKLKNCPLREVEDYDE